MSRRKVIFYNIIVLFVLYFSIALLFCVIYLALDFMGLGSISDLYSSTSHQEQPLDLLTRSLYFSFITLFAVGYGDMVPLGLSKGVAIIEAAIGYILPYVIILNYLVFNPRFIKLIQRKFSK